ncbi:hypothetical protein ABZW49_10825 [Nonomuraea wenchangensis]
MTTATFTPRFEPLPPKTRRLRATPVDYQQIAATVCATPGEWALVWLTDTPHQAASIAHRINTRQVKTLNPRGVFQAKSRTVYLDDGRQECRVYVKYLGQPARVAS